MISLILLKRYELNSGRIFLASSRPQIGDFFHRKLSWLEYVLPGLIRVGMRRTYLLVRQVVRVWAARLFAKVERMLETALLRVRQSGVAPRRQGPESSAFLRQVTEHKKKLQEDLADRGTVIEE